jgi:hypothetical protein
MSGGEDSNVAQLCAPNDIVNLKGCLEQSLEAFKRLSLTLLGFEKAGFVRRSRVVV